MHFGALVLLVRVGEENFLQQRYATAVLAFHRIQWFLEALGNFTKVKVIINVKVNNGVIITGQSCQGK